MRIRTSFCLLVLGISVNSCATLINRKSEPLTVLTDLPTELILGHMDTIKGPKTERLLVVNRSKKSLPISVISENGIQEIELKSKISIAYWMNLWHWTLFPGLIFDWNKPERFSYPRTIYIESGSEGYLKYRPLDTTYANYRQLIKFTPLKVLGTINPAAEISFEQKVSPGISLQVGGAHLLPDPVWDHRLKYDIKGSRFSLEGRYYWKKSAPQGPYIAMEFSHYNSSHYDQKYRTEIVFETDSTESYIEHENTIFVKKKTYELNFKLGYQHIHKRFSFDAYFGFGARYRDVVHQNKLVLENENFQFYEHIDLHELNYHEGQEWVLRVPFNFRIGWVL